MESKNKEKLFKQAIHELISWNGYSSINRRFLFTVDGPGFRFADKLKRRYLVITRTLSPTKISKKQPRRSQPTWRALALAGIVDCYLTDTGRFSYPPHALDQLRAHEEKIAAERLGTPITA